MKASKLRMKLVTPAGASALWDGDPLAHMLAAKLSLLCFVAASGFAAKRFLDFLQC